MKEITNIDSDDWALRSDVINVEQYIGISYTLIVCSQPQLVHGANHATGPSSHPMLDTELQHVWDFTSRVVEFLWVWMLYCCWPLGWRIDRPSNVITASAEHMSAETKSSRLPHWADTDRSAPSTLYKGWGSQKHRISVLEHFQKICMSTSR